ncbi:MAG: septum formation initiator family protein [Desulfobacteraceae bacterium]|nr:septum formation initiator family protein [Desulfobacteraceae bacterium]
MKFKTFSIFFLIISFVYFSYIIFNDQGYLKVKELESRKNSLEDNNQKIEGQIEDLSRKVVRLKNDPKYIEHVIRNEFNMVKEDEIVLFIEDKKLDEKTE